MDAREVHSNGVETLVQSGEAGRQNAEKSPFPVILTPLRGGESHLGANRINQFQIASSLTLLAMPPRFESFITPLEL
jgi:hypothetical protein